MAIGRLVLATSALVALLLATGEAGADPKGASGPPSHRPVAPALDGLPGSPPTNVLPGSVPQLPHGMRPPLQSNGDEEDEGPLIPDEGEEEVETEEDRKFRELKEKAAELDKQRAELEGKLSDLKDEFLKSKAGKDAGKAIDRETERKDQRIKDATKAHAEELERIKREQPDEVACCIDREIFEPADALLVEATNDAIDDHRDAVDQILGEELGKHDPKASQEFQQLQKDLAKAKAELAKANQAVQQAQGTGVATPAVSP